MDDLVIGIDLGTTNSCVALYENGNIKILENDLGGRITPSFVFFMTQGPVIVGEHGKKMAVHKPENGVYEMKRLVGRKYDDSKLQKSLQYFPFKVSPDSSNNPLVSVDQNNCWIKKSPREICTVFLQRLKKYTEAKLNRTVSKVVITVPAYFNITQREVTFAAAQDAGFTVLKLLNEPTAAALAYYFTYNINETHRSLVYDLGGGTFDVAILEKRSENIEVLCVSGDTHLGGVDFDNCILNYVFRVLKSEYNYDPIDDSDDKRRLRNKCEDAKKDLSSMDEAVITINGMVPEYPKIKVTITRQRFEEMAGHLFRRSIDIMDSCLEGSKIPRESIQEVILSGGSTRIPKIQEMVSNYFGGKKLNKTQNLDECVAEGAALQAAMLSTNPRQKIDGFEMTDVVPLSLGFDSLGNKMIFAIKRNTKIPTSASQVYSNLSDETTFSIGIYEGERADARKNRRLGTIEINDVAQAPPDQSEVNFTLIIDHNGILTAKAEERNRSNSRELRVNYTSGDRNESEIKNTLIDAVENKKVDEKFVKFVNHKRYLIKYCVAFMYNLDTRKLKNRYKDEYSFCEDTKTTATNTEMDEEYLVKDLIKSCKRKCEAIAKNNDFKFLPQEPSD